MGCRDAFGVRKRKEGKGFEEKKQRRRDDVRWKNEGKSCEGIK